MPSFEDVTPTVLQSSVPQESRANMKNKVLEIISFLLFWVQLLFSQKLAAGAYAHLSVWTWLKPTAGVWGESRMRRTPSPLLWLGRCAVWGSHKHIPAHSDSHTFIHNHVHVSKDQLVHTHTHTHIHACSHSHSQKTQTDVDSCTLTNRSSQQNSKQRKRVFSKPHALSTKGRHTAFIQQQQPYLLLNNTVLMCQTEFSAYCMST